MAENRNQGNSAAPQDLNQLRKVRREKLAYAARSSRILLRRERIPLRS